MLVPIDRRIDANHGSTTGPASIAMLSSINEGGDSHDSAPDSVGGPDGSAEYCDAACRLPLSTGDGEEPIRAAAG